MSLSVNAESEISTRIVGGTEAAKGDWPFMTALIYKGQNAYSGQFCGASFIGGRYVLTAAHCVDHHSADTLDVLIGIHDLTNESSEGERVGVQAIYMHDGYNLQTVANDIAVIELEKEVTAATIPLATKSQVDALTTSNNLTVIGWGNLSSTSYSYPSILNQVDVPYVERSTCQNLGGIYNFVTDDNICAGFPEGGKDSCSGDSGGPLIYSDNGTDRQVGIVSWGNGCAQRNAYGVYTNVGYFNDDNSNNTNWISNHTNGVSYTQHIYLTSTTDQASITLPIRNYSPTPFNITNITLPAGVTMTQNTCITTLAKDDSCTLLVQVNFAGVTKATTTVSVTTDHPVSNQLAMKIVFPSTNQEISSGSSGGASLGLGLLALFGLRLRRNRG
ncbi:trypsin-like serine protease [Vibrio sp. PP-XX7]